jgi:hypothetical protein
VALLITLSLVYLGRSILNERNVVYTRKLVQLRLRNNQTLSGGVFLFMGSIHGQTELQYSAYIETEDGGKVLFSAPADSCVIYEDGKNYVQFQVRCNRYWNVKFHIPKNSIAQTIDVNIPGGNE